MGLFRFLFLEKKCLVHTAFGNEKYFKAANQLQADGVSFDTVRKMNANTFGTVGSDIPYVRNATVDNAQYDFYVKKDDEYRALQALR